MSVSKLQVYEIFKKWLGEKNAMTVMEYIESKTENKYPQKNDILGNIDDKKAPPTKKLTTTRDVIT